MHNLRFYDSPSWQDKDIAGSVDAKVSVKGTLQYKVHNSKGKTYYCKSSLCVCEVIKKSIYKCQLIFSQYPTQPVIICDVVKLAAIPGSVAAIISLCKIEAILPPATTVTAEFDFNGIDVANKA